MTNTLSDLTMEGDITVGTNNITMTGNLSSSEAPVSAAWIADLNTSQVNSPTTAGIGIQGRTDGVFGSSGNIGEAFRVASLVNTSAAVIISIASPGVVTYTNHGLTTGVAVYFTTTGSLPTGLSTSTNYFVIVLDVNTFSLATSAANAQASHVRLHQ